MSIKIMREMTVYLSSDHQFRVGDKIEMIDGYSATCQRIDSDGAIFLMDQNVAAKSMFYYYRPYENHKRDFFNYEKSDLRSFVKICEGLPIFHDIRRFMEPFENGDLLRIPYAEEMFSRDYVGCFATGYRESISMWDLMRKRKNRIAYVESMDDWTGNTILQNRCFNGDNFLSVNSYGDLTYVSMDTPCGVRLVFKIKLREDE